MAWVKSLAQGLWLGVAVVLPGLSGGTAALVLGIYERLIGDLARWRWRPHLPLAAGAAAGVLAGARLLERVLAAAPHLLAAFLLGVILASAWRAFARYERGQPAALGAWAAGIALALAAAGRPLTGAGPAPADLPWPALFLAGAAAGTAMMLPGMSGATVLILLGVYDDLLLALNRLLPLPLAVCGAGVAVGALGAARAVARLLARAPGPTGLFLAGMLLGSVRAVFPGRWDAAGLALALLGAAAVLGWRERVGDAA